MVQIVNQTPSIGQLFGEGFGQAASQTLSQRLGEKRKEQKNKEALDLLDSEEDFMELPFFEQQKKIRAAFAHDPDQGQKMIGDLLTNKLTEAKAKNDELAALKSQRTEDRAKRTEARADSKEAREQAKFERDSTKPSSSKQSVFQKEMEKKAVDYYFKTVEAQDKANRSLNTIDRLDELSKKLEGGVGIAKAIFGTESAAEYNALGLSATDSVLSALFPTRVTDAKFKKVQEKFAPSAGELATTQRGKHRALKTFAQEVAAKGDRMARLIEEFGSIENVPPERLLDLAKAEEAQLDRLDASADKLIAEEVAKEESPILAPSVNPTPSDKTSVESEATPPIDPTPSDTIRQEKEKEKVPEKTKKDEKPKKKAFFDYLDKKHQKTINEVLEINDFFKKRHEKQKRFAGVVGRGATKGVGTVADFGNFLVKLVTGSKVPVEDVTKSIFGKSMDFEEVAEKAYDYVTSDGYIPDGPVERVVEKGAQAGAEFFGPAALMKAAKSGELLLEGATAGMLSQTAKEADLGKEAEILPYFLRPMASMGKKGRDGLVELITNPNALRDFWGRTKDWMGSKVEAVKQTAKAPFAKAAVQRLGLEKTKPNEKRIEELSKRGLSRSPISEVFGSEKVYALEAKIAAQADAAEIYKPLFEELNTERIEKYGEFLASTASQKGQDLLGRVQEPGERKEIRNVFESMMDQKRKEVSEQVGQGYNVLRHSRTKKDRISWRDTKYLLDGIERSREKIKRGGVGPNDEAVLKYLNSLEKRLLIKSPETTKRINELQQELRALSVIPESSPVYAKNVAPKKRQLAELMKEGALVVEVEAAHKVINAGMNWDKALKFPQHMKLEAKKSIERAIKNYASQGKKQEKYSKLFFSTKEKYADAKNTVLSDMLWDVKLGQEPKLLFSLLDKPEGVDWFKKILPETNLQTAAAGREVLAAKAHGIIAPKLFDSKGRIKATPGKLSAREQELLHSLIGDKNYTQYKTMATEFGENPGKVNAYFNASRSHANARADVKALSEASGVFSIARGLFRTLTGGTGLKEMASGAVKIAGSKSDKVTAMLLTDHSVQRAMIDVIRESKKAKPAIGPMNRLAVVVGKSLKRKGKKFVEKSGKRASLSNALGIEETLYPEEK